MPGEFNFIKRSSELISQGCTDEEMAAIMETEEAEADSTVLDDVSWQEIMREIVEGAEERYQASLSSPHER